MSSIALTKIENLTGPALSAVLDQGGLFLYKGVIKHLNSEVISIASASLIEKCGSYDTKVTFARIVIKMSEGLIYYYKTAYRCQGPDMITKVQQGTATITATTGFVLMQHALTNTHLSVSLDVCVFLPN